MATCGPSDEDWRASSDHDTLSRAADIHSDPSRMAGVRNHQVKQVKSLKKMDETLGDGKLRGSKDYKGLMKSLKTRR